MNNSEQSVSEKVAAVQDYILQCNGTENYYKHPFSKVVYSDGVKFVAETCGAHWLIDLILSHQTNAKVRAQEFQVWSLDRAGVASSKFIAICEDGNGNVVTRQVIDYTDFPAALFPIKFYVENGVLYLPAER